MKNTVTIDLEMYDEFKKAKEFFEHFSEGNGVFLGYSLNFSGNITKWILTSDETVTKIAYNLNESRLENAGLRDKLKTSENNIRVLKENKQPWHKRIF